MEKLLSLAFLAFLSSLLILQAAQAINMGSLIKNDFLNLRKGESGKFTILFWNAGSETYKVDIETKKAPKDWIIEVQPKEFSLDSSTGKENIFLPYLGKSVKALPVNIFVKPLNAESGEYEIIVLAKASLQKEGISFLPESVFKLRVNLVGEKVQEEIENKTLNPQETLQPISNIIKKTSSSIYITAIITILVISLIIYKYA
jgi:uncharacterized membrane protein